MYRERFRLLPALLLAAVLAACGKGEDELLASAKQYLDKRDTKAAVIQLKNLLDKKPSSAQGRFLLGKALLESGDAAGAEAEFRRALDLKYPEAQVAPQRARALLAQGQARKVIEDYGSTDLRDPQYDIELQTSLAQAHASVGAMEDARAAVDRALGISPAYGPALVMSARLKAAGGDVDGAITVLDGLLAKAPSNTDGLQFKADLLWRAKNQAPAAVELYRKALETNNNLPEAHSALITVLLQQRQLDEAGKQLDALKKIRGNHPQTRFLEAQLAYSRSDFKLARELIQPVLQAAPSNPRTLQFAGAIELQLGALQQAETLLGKAVQLAPNAPEARRLLADTFLRLRQPEKALSTLRPMLESPTVSPQVLALAAQAHMANGDTKTAESLFARASKLKPDDKRLSAAVALTQLAKGNSEAAFGDLERIAATDDGRSIDMALISARMQRKEFDAALKAIDALEKKQADSPVPAQLRGRVYIAKQDLDNARKAFEQALAKDPKYLPAAAGLASIDMQQKKPDDAQARFQSILKQDPKNTQALLALAELKARSGANQAEITKLFADAVAANPTDIQARVAQIDHLASLRDTKGALAAAQAAVAAVPNNAELLDRLGRTQLAAGEREQALSTYGKLSSMRPDAAVGPMGTAAAHMAAKDLESAARSVRQALEREPDSLAAHRMAIYLAWQQQKPQEAIAAARRLQERRPDDGAGFISEGEVEMAQKHWDPAAAAFRKALTKTEASLAATKLHQTLLQAQRGAEAAKFAEGWVKQHPDDVSFLFYLGDAALGSSDLVLAEARYLEVLKRQPENALALNNVAWLKMRLKKPGALEYAERAVKIAPGRPPLMDTLALVLSAEGQHAKAIEVQKKVVADMPKVSGFRFNLAKIYIAAGDKPKARAELQELAKLGKEFPGQDEVAKLLKSVEGP
ncbi:MAG: PEP-CTERM system TPR-repeat protein PrsT [Burkholderiales bacterium]|nr:PEP-CTERM system TPR-repeat protein PrsT [Burkholderiales bacterium]